MGIFSRGDRRSPRKQTRLDETRPTDNATHFGFQEVDAGDKSEMVADVFHSVAPRYDLMNDLMTLRLHRRWKSQTIKIADIKPGEDVLDLASGTGDLALRIADKVGPDGSVVVSDINSSMLAGAKEKFSKRDVTAQITFVEADAEELPFDDASFDLVTISFGMRNVTNKSRSMAEILRVLRPGGRLLILEFSRPVAAPVRPFYDAYSFAVIPTMGKVVLNDAASYRYLAESIRVHPDRDRLRVMLDDVGFVRTDYTTMLFGIVAAHRGFKA